METYLEFLRSKIVLASETGFTLPPEEINPALKPHQRDAVVWALRGGRRHVEAGGPQDHQGISGGGPEG